jgi:hypothetical protein
VGRGLAWAVVGTTVGGAQHVPMARCPSAGDEHAPSMGPAWRVLPAAGRTPTRGAVGTSDGWNDARTAPPLDCVYDQQYTVGVVKRQQVREQKFLRNNAEESIVLFPYG